MTAEGQYGVVDGDIFYSSTWKSLINQMSVNQIQGFLQLDYTGSAPSKNFLTGFTTVLGSLNMVNSESAVSGNYFNGVVDNFTITGSGPLGSIWQRENNNTELLSYNANNYMRLSSRWNLNTGSGWVAYSGTALLPTFGNYMEIGLGSFLTNQTSVSYKVNFNESTIHAGSTNSSGGIIIQIKRTSPTDTSFSYRRLIPGGDFNSWTTATYADTGSLYFMLNNSDGGTNDVLGSLFVDYVRVLSGVIPFSVTLRPSVPNILRYQDSGLATQGIFWMNGSGNILGSYFSSFSFNSGTNFTNCNIGSWTTASVAGSTVNFRWIQSGTFGSGLGGGPIITNIGLLYN